VQPYDAVVLVSFGGPERPEEVMPFLERVTRGRPVPRARLEEVAAHYQRFGGRSPINDLNRSLLAALRSELDDHGHADLGLYWGNRNAAPFIVDAVAQMAADGVRRALAFVTSAYSSYSGCRQYLDDIEAARAEVGPSAPEVDKLRAFYDHPGFIEPQARRAQEALDALGEAKTGARLVFCAHSVPLAMATTSPYVAQLEEACRLVTARLDEPRPFDLVWQSRSGPPTVPWLEPDVNDHLRDLHRRGVEAVVLVPVGFIADHMEVVYDLDTEALATAGALGLRAVRAATVGTDPRFVAMVRQLIEERAAAPGPRLALGRLELLPDRCAPGCCPAPVRPG
jgi:ferrochelatase